MVPLLLMVPWHFLDAFEGSRSLAHHRCEHLGVVSHGPPIPLTLPPSSPLQSGCRVKVVWWIHIWFNLYWICRLACWGSNICSFCGRWCHHVVASTKSMPWRMRWRWAGTPGMTEGATGTLLCSPPKLRKGSLLIYLLACLINWGWSVSLYLPLISWLKTLVHWPNIISFC